MTSGGSGRSSEDSLSSIDRKLSDWQCLKDPIAVSINLRVKDHVNEDYIRSGLSPDNPMFRYVATGLSSALATLCSRPGHEAMIKVAKEICLQTQIGSKLSEDMQAILISRNDTEAHNYVVKFRDILFKQLPVIFIDEQIDEKRVWATTSTVIHPVYQQAVGGIWQRMISLHISKWLVECACAAAEKNDIDQFQNYLLRIKDFFCHEIGGHMLRIYLQGPGKVREPTPTGVGLRPDNPYFFHNSLTEAGACLERHLFGGKGHEVIEIVDESQGYPSFTPCIWKTDHEDIGFTYAREIPRHVIKRVLEQDFMINGDLYPYKVESGKLKVNFRGFYFLPTRGRNLILGPYKTLADAQPRPSILRQRLDIVPLFGEMRYRTWSFFMNSEEVRKIPSQPKTKLEIVRSEFWREHDPIPRSDETVIASSAAQATANEIVDVDVKSCQEVFEQSYGAQLRAAGTHLDEKAMQKAYKDYIAQHPESEEASTMNKGSSSKMKPVESKAQSSPPQTGGKSDTRSGHKGREGKGRNT